MYWMIVIIFFFNVRYIFIWVVDFKYVNFFVNFIKSFILEKLLFNLVVMLSCFWRICWKVKLNEIVYIMFVGVRK